jgi:hypothetical protein
VLSIAKNVLGDSLVLEGRKIDPPLLLLGLVYREVCCSMEIESDSPSALKSSLVLVLDSSGLKLGTEPVLYFQKYLKPQTEPCKTGLSRLFTSSQTCPAQSGLDPVPTSLSELVGTG